MSHRRFASIFVLLSVAALLRAQENRASVSGQVTDPTGASVPNAIVQVTSLEPGITKDTLTNEAGRYQVGFQPGAYRLDIEASGFKKYIRDQVTLVTGQKMGLTSNSKCAPRPKASV